MQLFGTETTALAAVARPDAQQLAGVLLEQLQAIALCRIAVVEIEIHQIVDPAQAGMLAQLIDEIADRGEVEFCGAYAGPFTMLVVADLLGVPPEDHATLVGWLQGEGEEKNLADYEGKVFRKDIGELVEEATEVVL